MILQRGRSSITSMKCASSQTISKTNIKNAKTGSWAIKDLLPSKKKKKSLKSIEQNSVCSLLFLRNPIPLVSNTLTIKN